MKPPRTNQHPTNHRLWILDEPYVVPTPSGGEYVVPAGFVTDYASIPFWAWSIIRRVPSDVSGPAVPHDALCRDIDPGKPGAYERRAAVDAAFLYWLALWGEGRIRRFVMFHALRIHAIFGGWKSDARGTNGEPKRFLKYVTDGAKVAVPWYRRLFSRRQR